MSLLPCAVQAAKLAECAVVIPVVAKSLCLTLYTCRCDQTVTSLSASRRLLSTKSAEVSHQQEQQNTFLLGEQQQLQHELGPLQQKQQQYSMLSHPPELQLYQQPFLRPYGSCSGGRRHFSSLSAAASALLASRQQPAVCPAAGHHQELLLSQPQHQLQQQQGLKQLRPYAEAPNPLPRYRKPSKDGRMNRMVIRVPPQVQLELRSQQLLLTGKAGSTSLRLSFLDPTGLVAWQCHTQSTAAAASGPGTGSLLLLASPSKRCWRGIQTHINNAVHGVMQGYLVGVTVQGVGYRMEPVPETTIAAALAARRGAADAAADNSSSKRRIIWEQEAEKTNIAYPHKQPAKAVRLKVGYTRACIFQLPEGVLAFFIKPTLMYLYGVDKALVTNTAAAIRAIRKPNAYTGNGIQLVGETLKLKQRAGSK